ncbi:MAG: ISAs1 family transposase, partial [Mobilitalea sp.]
KCFIEWMKRVVQLEEKDIISLDGKTMRGSIEGDSKRGVHIVSALCNSHSLVIGQVKTEEKSNEITAIPELLDMLYIKGCIVTIDALLFKALNNIAYTKLYIMQSWMLRAA